MPLVFAFFSQYFNTCNPKSTLKTLFKISEWYVDEKDPHLIVSIAIFTIQNFAILLKNIEFESIDTNIPLKKSKLLFITFVSQLIFFKRIVRPARHKLIPIKHGVIAKIVSIKIQLEAAQ